MATQSQDLSQNPSHRQGQVLTILDPGQPHTFLVPSKKINEGHDVPHFLISKAYRDIGMFVMQLNIAMCPKKTSKSQDVQTWQLDTELKLPESVHKLQQMLERIDTIIEEAPPNMGPRRFGNVSFRKWYEILESRVQQLLRSHLTQTVLEFRRNSSDQVTPLDELTPYLLGAFGSSQRLDYGTGHELSFLAFLGCIWNLAGSASRITLTERWKGALCWVSSSREYRQSLPYVFNFISLSIQVLACHSAFDSDLYA